MRRDRRMDGSSGSPDGASDAALAVGDAKSGANGGPIWTPLSAVASAKADGKPTAIGTTPAADPATTARARLVLSGLLPKPVRCCVPEVKGKFLDCESRTQGLGRRFAYILINIFKGRQEGCGNCWFSCDGGKSVG